MELIRPDWPAPASVHACVTTRDGGVSCGPFASLNLADHVGDDPACVQENRELLRDCAGLPGEPVWLRQVHGCGVARANATPGCEADACIARRAGEVCAILTADCLPVLLCDREGSCVAAAHAGWRGLADGVIEQTVTAMQCPPARLLAWLGPAIGPAHFEVGPEVRERFVATMPEAAQAFHPRSNGHWLADLFLLARQRLERLGVTAVHGGGECTHAQPQRFFSYRRDGVTGRMASLIWLADDSIA